jgi:hypothetical protein
MMGRMQVAPMSQTIRAGAALALDDAGSDSAVVTLR